MTVATSLLACLAIGLGGLLVLALLSVDSRPRPLDEVFQNRLRPHLIEKSGVANPVTAVLLNFRAYDTLLELVVLILAVLSAHAGLNAVAREPRCTPRRHDPLFSAAVTTLVPISIVVAGYLLWRGADYPGGAFQASGVLSGAGILLILAGRARSIEASGWQLRLAVVAGVVVFLSVGIGVVLLGERFLQYPEGSAKMLILAIETAAMASVAAVFIRLFNLVAQPAQKQIPYEDSGDSKEQR